jgi:flagellar protein FliL
MPHPDLDNHLSAFDEESDKAALDRGAPSSKLPDGARKVELDLDDAPFLDNDYTPPTEQAPGDEARKAFAHPDQEQPEVVRRRPRLFLVLGAATAATLAAITVAVVLLLPWHEDEVTIPEPSYLVSLEPFYIEQQASDGLRFLQCRFTLPAGNAALESEIRAKQLLLRDALFFALSRREPTFLNQPEEATLLKRDLLTVINQLLTTGQLGDMHIAEYVIR